MNETLIANHSNEFRTIKNLLMQHYDDIEKVLFLPNFKSETQFNYNEYTLFISAKSFDDLVDYDLYLELFDLFNDCLTDKENDLISRITKLHTQSKTWHEFRNIDLPKECLIMLKPTN